MNISIVIPNRNGARLLEKNLPSVIAAAKGAEIIIVDDASTDDSVHVLTKNFPSVRIVKKATHEGFASTVNAGVSAAKGDIVILLNTDVRPEKDLLPPLVKHFDDPLVFAVGCMDRSMEDGKAILRGRGVAKWERGFFVHSRGEVEKKTTAWVAGGSGAFRKSIWQKLGGMDTRFDPFYWEDIDLSYRAVRLGFRILFEPASVVIHEHERGIIKNEYSSWQVAVIAYRNQFLFVWKHIPGPRVLLAHAVWTPIRLLQALLRGDFAMIAGYVWAMFRMVMK